MAQTLRLILGDQLNYNHSWYKKPNHDHLYIIMEMKQESAYVTHHIQKIIGFFAAMYNFARHLTKNGHKVIHLKINDPENQQVLTSNLEYFITKFDIKKFEYQLPDEYRLDQQLRDFCQKINIKTEVFDTEHFLSTRDELARHFEGKKNFVMESFYRMMRKKHQILIEDTTGEPIGGKWNFDAENRKSLPSSLIPPPPKYFEKEFRDILHEIDTAGIKYLGSSLAEKYPWPVSRKEALMLLDYFCDHLLPKFGKYQDAMHTGYWAMYHSRISFAMNIKMISPLEVINKVLHTWSNGRDKIDIAQTEGFIRQILGWREYMRGIYWVRMPQYASLNYFGHSTALPKWFWTGDTKMNCLKYSICQSLEYAYAHHIQRLMVTGNFALLAGIDPDEVDLWYLGIYIDAIEWVEITNTRGMSQYADGGIVGTKPYVSSANYIHKMSNYCKNCHYNKDQKTGVGSCPFNSLYWNFYIKHESLLRTNPRIGMAYNLLDKMTDEVKMDIIQTAEKYLGDIDNL